MKKTFGMECVRYAMCLRLQLDYFGAPYVVGVVLAHVAFALLEKKRIENFRETGEVCRRFLTRTSDNRPSLSAPVRKRSRMLDTLPKRSQKVCLPFRTALAAPPPHICLRLCGVQAGHLGAEPTFDPLGLTEANPLGTDYNRQAEVTVWAMAHPFVNILTHASCTHVPAAVFQHG